MPVQVVDLEGVRTWTVVGADHLPVDPVEEFLDHLRVAQQSSPNTVRSYATSLDQWWRYLAGVGLAWDEVTLNSRGHVFDTESRSKNVRYGSRSFLSLT